MKKELMSLFILIALLTNQLIAQNTHKGKVSSAKIYSAKFIDSNLFLSDIKNKLDLKSIFNALKKDSLMGAYGYSFDVNKQGGVVPIVYHDQKTARFEKIQEFVMSTFNRYKWATGYQRQCTMCKITSHFKFFIVFETDKNDIDIEIEDLMQRSTIFHLNIKC